MIRHNINKYLIFIVMAIICLNLTVEHWHNFQNYELETKNYYEKFDEYIDHEINQYVNNEDNFQRTVDNIGGVTLLEEREKTRWVFQSFMSEIMLLSKNISINQSYYPQEKVVLYVYSIFIGIIFYSIFVFLYLSIIEISKNNNIVFKIKNFNSVYLFFTYFLTIGYLNFIHYTGGEDNFSLFETFFLIAGLYFVLKDTKISLFFYFIVCLLAPFVRESAILISAIYFLYHFLVNKRFITISLLLPLICIVPYLISNYDILQYYLNDGFILTTQSVPHQTTWHDLSTNFIGTMNAIFYNFLIFILPLAIFFKKENRLQNFLLLLIIIYFGLLAFASVLDHLTTRFMPAVLLILYVYIALTAKK